MANTGTHIDGVALSNLTASIRNDVENGLYDAAVVTMAHRGKIVLEEAIGFAEHDAAGLANKERFQRLSDLAVTTVIAL